MTGTLYIVSSGQLKREGNTIALVGERKQFFPVENIREIYIFGEVTLTKKVLEFFTQNKIIVHIYNYYGYYVGTYYPREYYNSGYIIVKQVEHYINQEKRLDIAKRIVQGAASNMENTLKYYNKKGKNLAEHINKISETKKHVTKVNTINELMAREGQIRKTYYNAFNVIITNPEFQFEKRTKRPPQTMLNALISLGNQLLYTTVLSEIYKTHLDPRIGYLHTTNYRRFTLNLDIAEIFKPIIPDRVNFTLINKKKLTANHFKKSLNGIILNKHGLKIYLKEYDKKINSTVKHPKLKKNVTYKTLIRQELYKIEKHIINDQPYQPYITTW